MLPISDAQRAALTAPAVDVDFGAHLLDGDDRVIGDLSADVLDVSVERAMYADVHGTCELSLTRDLAWGVDRVRPWMSVNGFAWPLSVFVLTSPEVEAGEEPRTRRVSGFDKLWLLQGAVGDTYVVDAGTSYLDAIRGVLVDAGVPGGLLLQGDRQDTVLAEPAVWVLTETGPSWLRVVNDLLGMIGYRGLWADEIGRFRSEPYIPAEERGSVWVFDTADPLTSIVGEDRSLSADVWGAPNWWRFVRRMGARPVEGGGVYTVDRVAGSAPRRRVVFLDAADQASLVSQGDRIVGQDTQATRLVTLECSPLPLTHFDVVTLTDPDLGLFSARGLVRRWSVDGGGVMGVEVEVL